MTKPYAVDAGFVSEDAGGAIRPKQGPRPLRILYVFPGEATGSVMIHAMKQVEAIKTCHISAETFSLASRTSVGRLGDEIKRFRQRIACFRPDVVHAQYGTMTAFFSSVSTRLPLVITFRGSDLNPYTGGSRMRALAGHWLSRAAAAKAARIICVSEQLKRRLWIGRERAVVLPSGVDTQLFFPRPRAEARSDLGWNNTESIVVFNAGAWPVGKRLDLARAGVSKAEAVCGTIRFVVLDGTVPQDKVATMLNAADALVVTSDWEGSPTIVQEALACNLPVVSVDVGDVRERLTGIVPSHIVERDADCIGQALAAILARPVRSNGCAVVETISQAHIARQTVAVYRTALQQHNEA
jgi:teichuronic acid biosynthesis glycosyltransferase TuaC